MRKKECSGKDAYMHVNIMVWRKHFKSVRKKLPINGVGTIDYLRKNGVVWIKELKAREKWNHKRIWETLKDSLYDLGGSQKEKSFHIKIKRETTNKESDRIDYKKIKRM